MVSGKRTRGLYGLLIAAALINGLLAGGNVDRALIAMPAWRHIGPIAWADFSRYADLGSGQFIYPIMAIGGTIVTVLVAVLALWPSRSPRAVAFPILLAATLMLAALPFSFKAAPFMLSLHHINADDVAALGGAFSGFEFWGRLQGTFHVAAFCANLCSLVVFGQHSVDAPPGAGSNS